jgi:hypothetical protein
MAKERGSIPMKQGKGSIRMSPVPACTWLTQLQPMLLLTRGQKQYKEHPQHLTSVRESEIRDISPIRPHRL